MVSGDEELGGRLDDPAVQRVGEFWKGGRATSHLVWAGPRPSHLVWAGPRPSHFPRTRPWTALQACGVPLAHETLDPIRVLETFDPIRA